MPQYDRAPAQRFNFAGMNTVLPPDALPAGKYPLAINCRAYLKDQLTPRLPQTANVLTAPLPALIHSLRRMDDTTPAPIVGAPTGPNGCGTGTDVAVPSGVPWSNPGNITLSDGNFAVTTVSPVTGSQGPNSPTAASSVSAPGGSVWANPTRIEVQDGSYSTTVITDGAFSQLLRGSGYGFSIPAGATITGIAVTIFRSRSGIGAITDQGVFLLKAGIPTGSNHAGGLWPSGFSSNTYGGPADLWGAAWTPADINNAGFGVQLQAESAINAATVGVDYISITVYYNLAASVISDLLQGTNFGFALGGGLVLTGILVEVQGLQTGNAPLTLQMLKAGVAVGSAKTFNLPAANNFIALGGSLDLWGTTWTPADINNANFGISLQAAAGTVLSTVSVDFVRITVYAYTPSGLSAGFVLVSGATDKVYVGTTQVQAGMSGKRLALVPFRPNTSVAPWMYIGDSNKLIKVRSDATTYQQGIKEPQAIPGLALSGAGPITGNIQYAYKYRSSATGAQSNPSPTAHSFVIVAAANAIAVNCAPSADPQVDLIDVYRFGDVLDYTYVTTIFNSVPNFIDNLSAVAIANNPLMAFDDYEPFPSIDTPRTGTCNIAAGPVAGTVTLTQTGGDVFNIRWLGGTIIQVAPAGGAAPQVSSLILFARPTSTTVLVAQIQPVGAALAPGGYNFSISVPILAKQPLPAFWGPTDNAAFMFACGDPLRPGTLYFTKGNQPDSAPQTNSIELTSPAEPLIGGCIVGGLSLVLSGERGWLIYPNFAQATASIVGVAGSPFTTVPSISDRGLFCKEGICTDGGGSAYYIAKDSIRKSPGGVGSQSITDDDLYNLFPHEGNKQQIYTLAGITVWPPDYSQPDGMALRFSQGYVYFDYIGLDNNRYTLAYDTVNDAWSVDSYQSVATIHADDPGAFISPGPNVPIGPLMGCTDGTIRQLSSAGTESGVNTAMIVATPAFDAGEQRATKHYGDIYVETTTPAGVTGNFNIQLYASRYANLLGAGISPTAIPAVGGIRVGSVLELNGGDGVYANDIELLISVPINDIGSILHLWQPSSILQPETTGERVSDWYDGGNNGAKFLQGVIIEADTGNVPKKFASQSGDDLSVNQFQEVGTGVAFNGRSKKAFSMASPPISHNFRLLALDTVPWRVWGVEWIWVPVPEIVQEWHTELVSHGLKGWQHIGELNVAHISTADIVLTFVTDLGQIVPVVIPNSGGNQVKTYITIPAFKFKLVAYNFTSPQPYRLWKEDMEVKVKEWGSPGPYQIVRPFGGPSAAQAEI